MLSRRTSIILVSLLCLLFFGTVVISVSVSYADQPDLPVNYNRAPRVQPRGLIDSLKDKFASFLGKKSMSLDWSHYYYDCGTGSCSIGKKIVGKQDGSVDIYLNTLHASSIENLSLPQSEVKGDVRFVRFLPSGGFFSSPPLYYKNSIGSQFVSLPTNDVVLGYRPNYSTNYAVNWMNIDSHSWTSKILQNSLGVSIIRSLEGGSNGQGEQGVLVVYRGEKGSLHSIRGVISNGSPIEWSESVQISPIEHPYNMYFGKGNFYPTAWGDMILFWTYSESGDLESQVEKWMSVYHSDSDSWDAPVSFFTGAQKDTKSVFYVVTGDEEDGLLFFISEGYNKIKSLDVRKIYTERYVNNTLQDKALIAEMPYPHSVRVLQKPDGNVLLVWRGPGNNVKSRLLNVASGSWDEEIVISNAPSNKELSFYLEDPQVDDYGNIFVMWQEVSFTDAEKDPSDLWVARFDNSAQAWDQANKIGEGYFYNMKSSLGVASNGSAFAVWQAPNSNADSVYVKRFLPESGWSHAIPLDNDLHLGINDPLYLHVSNDGAASVIWRDKYVISGALGSGCDSEKCKPKDTVLGRIHAAKFVPKP